MEIFIVLKSALEFKEQQKHWRKLKLIQITPASFCWPWSFRRLVATGPGRRRLEPSASALAAAGTSAAVATAGTAAVTTAAGTSAAVAATGTASVAAAAAGTSAAVAAAATGASAAVTSAVAAAAAPAAVGSASGTKGGVRVRCGRF